MHQGFAQKAESWLERPRNPHADTAFLDAVQRRQTHQNDASPMAASPIDPPETLASPAGGAVCLIKIQGQQASTVWLLPDNRPVVLGRSENSSSPLDINLWPDTGVSRRHAILWCDGAGWRIEDLGSTNGTLLDQSSIHGQRAIRLESGARVQVGSTTLLFLILTPDGERSIGEVWMSQDEVHKLASG